MNGEIEEHEEINLHIKKKNFQLGLIMVFFCGLFTLFLYVLERELDWIIVIMALVFMIGSVGIDRVLREED